MLKKLETNSKISLFPFQISTTNTEIKRVEILRLPSLHHSNSKFTLPRRFWSCNGNRRRSSERDWLNPVLTIHIKKFVRTLCVQSLVFDEKRSLQTSGRRKKKNLAKSLICVVGQKTPPNFTSSTGDKKNLVWKTAFHRWNVCYSYPEGSVGDEFCCAIHQKSAFLIG